jgi:KUP system potassium uptake protein
MRSSPLVGRNPSSAAQGLLIPALGVVFGDIGTSPLYAFRECFHPSHGIALEPANVLGLLSLVLWSLLSIISVKYVGIMLRADNRGEGGVLALSSLVSSESRNWRLWGPVSAVGVFGAALFFGDGFITPAISVLSAVEGLAVATPRLERFVLPGAILVLSLLFFMQRRGTGAMGRLFGPITLVWFITLAALGLRGIIAAPEVLLAINPAYAVHFFVENGGAAFVTTGSVFLAVTGGEALYADMGHFGRSPIRHGWFLIVLPALTLNYFGQGALLIAHPEAIVNPFYRLAPTALLPVLILFATAATVIASQAVISGVFSIARQAINLGYLPRLKVLHSSEEEIGQVYVPALNWLLFAGTLILILGFGSSTALAGAYGIAIASTMLIDSALVMILLKVRSTPHHNALLATLAAIMAIELAFFLSNLLKFAHGGWLPIAVAVAAYILMATWQEGRRTLSWLVAKEQMPLRDFLALIKEDPPRRVEGTAVYLANEAGGIPRALLDNVRFNHVLHERNVLLTFMRPEMPFVPAEQRVELETLGPGLYRIVARYGFMETPNVVAALRAAHAKGLAYEPEQSVYIVGRDNPVLTAGGMAMWRKRLFALMDRNSQLAAVHFGVPAHRLLEIGSQVKM